MAGGTKTKLFAAVEATDGLGPSLLDDECDFFLLIFLQIKLSSGGRYSMTDKAIFIFKTNLFGI